jgi:hypothetical protein
MMGGGRGVRACNHGNHLIREIIVRDNEVLPKWISGKVKIKRGHND